MNKIAINVATTAVELGVQEPLPQSLPSTSRNCDVQNNFSSENKNLHRASSGYSKYAPSTPVGSQSGDSIEISIVPTSLPLSPSSSNGVNSNEALHGIQGGSRWTLTKVITLATAATAMIGGGLTLGLLLGRKAGGEPFAFSPSPPLLPVSPSPSLVIRPSPAIARPNNWASWVWIYDKWNESLAGVEANADVFSHISPTFYSLNYPYEKGTPYYSNCDHPITSLNCSSPGQDDFGGLTTAQITKKLQSLKMQVIPAIYAGAGNGNGSDAGVRNILDNFNDAGDNFIRSMVAEGVAKGYNGYNLDWEMGKQFGRSYADKFLRFAAAFRQSLVPHKMSLSVDVIASNILGTWCSNNDGFLDIARMNSSHFDQVIIEAYSSSLGEPAPPGKSTVLNPNNPALCPLNSAGNDVTVLGLVELMKNNLPKDMLVVGLWAYSQGTNPIAGSVMKALREADFRQTAIWPQVEKGYPFMSNKNLIAPQSDWYGVLRGQWGK